MTGKSNRNTYTGDWTRTAPELSSECRLWRAVISQAISDAYLDDLKNKRNVQEWVGTEDFTAVCDLASMNPEYMKKIFNQILKMKPAIARFEGRRLKEIIDKN